MASRTLRERVESHPRVRMLVEEPSEDARWWVYFRPGWQASCADLHMETATTLTAALRAARDAIPCACRQCKEAMP